MRFLYVFLALISFSSASAQANSYETQKKYLIPAVSNLYISMPFREFKKLKPNAPAIKTEDTAFYENLKSGDMTRIEYYFYKGVLKEIIFKYKTTYNLASFLSQKYGKKNNTQQGIQGWKFRSGSLDLVIWQYENKHCVADADFF